MSKIDLSPLLPKIDEAVTAIITPPFQLGEVFTLIDTCGKLVIELLPLATKDEYEEALLYCWGYADGKYHLVDKMDEAVDFRELMKKILGSIIGIPVGVLAEVYDSRIFRGIVERGAVPKLASILADNVG
ncbi:hypothetical protein M0R72_10905 [Candidatus Pacearchaeota archaeon]|jgi:hypothetical protein|nr:hypothetical protein [Candidatus Pacearchaeota archaeon]